MLWIDEIASEKREVHGFVDFMCSDGIYLWSTNQDLLQKWCNTSQAVLAEVSVPQAAGIPVVAFNAVWVASLSHNAIYKIDRESNQILAIINTGLADQSGEFSLAASHDAIWVANASGYISKIDPFNNSILTTVKVLPFSYNLAVTKEFLWVTNTQNGSVQRIDPHTHRVTDTIAVGERPWFLSANDDVVWTLNQSDGTVSKIDATRAEVIATIQLPEQAQGDGGDIFAYGNRVWVRTTHLLLIEINATTNEIIRVIQHSQAAGSGAVMQCNHKLWITAHDINTVWILDVEA